MFVLDDAKEQIKVGLQSVLGNYISNPVDLDNIVNYVYKLSVIAFKGSGVSIDDEYQNLSGISVLDAEAFKHALKNISFIASREILFSTIKATYGVLKNQVPLAPVSKANGNVSSVYYSGNQPSTESTEGVFNIDLSKANEGRPSNAEIAKVVYRDTQSEDDRVKQILSRYQQSQASSGYASFDISGDSLDNINKGISNLGNLGTNGSGVSDDNSPSTIDASKFSSEVYDDVPDIKFDMNY